MKTFLFSGIAAASMMLAATGASGAAQQGSKVQSPDRTEDFREPEDGPSMQTDASIYQMPVTDVAPKSADKPGQVAFAAPDGLSYSYDGQWNGAFVDPKARVFKGDWSGTVTRHGAGEPLSQPGAAPYEEPHHEAGAPYLEPVYEDEDEDDYAVPPGHGSYKRCLKSSGLSGAAIGAILGGFAGNQIAGRGDRLGGTIVGAGLGGLAGAEIEKALDKCQHYRAYMPHPPVAYPQEGYSSHHVYGHTQTWQSGYYYYPQAPVVTVITHSPVTTTTTTVTEEVYYETIPAKRKRAIRHWKPKPKARCICR